MGMCLVWHIPFFFFSHQDAKQISGMGENVFHNISRNLIFSGCIERQSLARRARKVMHNWGAKRWKTFLSGACMN